MGSVMTTRPLGKTSFCTLCAVSTCIALGIFLSILARHGQKCYGSSANVSKLLTRKQNFVELATSASHRQKACRIRWNKLRRTSTDRNRCARWWRAGRIQEDSALDERALRAAPPQGARDPYRKHRKERVCRSNERRRECRLENFAHVDDRWASPSSNSGRDDCGYG